MTYTLTLLNILLVIIIIYSRIKFNRHEKNFKLKILMLESNISELNKVIETKSDKVELSNELNKTLTTVNRKLNSDVLSLNHELFGILSKNNLI